MIFKKVLSEIVLDTGQVGHEFRHKVQPEEEQEPKKRKKYKRKVFGSWFTNHNNLKHINKE